MKVSAHLTCERYPEFMTSLIKMENAGYERCWIVDSQMLWEDAYVYAALALEKTKRIELGTAVSNGVTRHYSVSASASVTLNNLYPGRWILGLGRGDSAVRTLGYKPMKTAEMEDVLRKTRLLLDGQSVDEDGNEIKLRWNQSKQSAQLCYAATGPRNLALGGALADIVMLQVGTHPAAVKWAIEHVHSGAREAGRDPKDIEIALLCGMWVSDDVKLARGKSQWAATCATNHLEDVERAGHVMPDELQQMLQVKRDQYDYYKGHLDSEADHTDYLTDEMIDKFAICGSVDTCREKIAELQALGVGEISSAYYNGEYDQLSFVGKEIISQVA